MHIDWWTLGLQTVNVLVLVWILSRYLFRPVTAIVQARQAETAKLLEEARAAKAEAASHRQAAADEAARLAASRAEALKAAAGEAEAEKAALVAAARAEADRLRKAAEDDIVHARQSAAAEVADGASRLAVDIAGKLLARLPDVPVMEFVDGLADRLADLPEQTRAAIGADGAPVRLRAARSLTGEELQTCRQKLGRALGRAIEVVVDADPGLIAGLELDAPHALVRNSFRADLDRISAELTRHDDAGR